MKTFITGGTGFIGGHVVRRLVQAGHEARCLVRATSDTSELEEMGVNLVTGDVTDRSSLLEGMDGCDWLVNLANIYSWWEPDKQIYWETNVDGTRNVLECALETDISKVVHVSTAYVYGKPEIAPFNEETPVGPERPSEYTRTKYEGDLIAWKFHEERGAPLVMIYPGAVLGAGDPKITGQYINRFIKGRVPLAAFSDSVHTYVDVSDVAEAIVLALEKADNIGEKYLVGKHPLSNQRYNELISQISGAAVPPPGPNAVIMLTAKLATWLADLSKKPPAVITLDYIRIVRDGCQYDGSKAERELGLTYSPIQETLEAVIDSLR